MKSLKSLMFFVPLIVSMSALCYVVDHHEYYIYTDAVGALMLVSTVWTMCRLQKAENK